MDRSREARRATMAASNGLTRRRHRTSSLRDSPEEDGPVELQETARLRDRGSGKKDRDRDRDRERDRDRDRDRERDRDRDRLSRSKRRRGDRSMHGNREDGGDDSSEESVNDEEEDEDDDGGGGGGGGGVGGGSVRMLPPPNPSVAAALSTSSSMLNHQRKSFPPAKNFRAPPTWKAADEMIGVSVPRKARSASTKRSHEWSSSGIGIVGEQIHRQTSTSPVRPSLSAAASAGPTASQAPVSPSSSNASVRKKLKPSNGPKPRQPKPSSRSSSSAQDEIEIEIAEVLYGMMRQPQGPSKQEIMANDSIKLESRETNNKSTSDANKSSSDAKSRVSSPISSSQYGVPPQSSSRSSQPGGETPWALCIAAPKRKKPRLVKYEAKYEEAKASLLTPQSNPITSTAKVPADQPAKTEASSAPLEKTAGSAAENGGLASDTAQSHAGPARATEAQPEPIKLEKSVLSESKSVAEKSESRDVGVSKEEPQSPKKESPGLRLDDKRETMTATVKSNSTVPEIETQREEKFQIDLMAPPPSRSSPEREGEIEFVAADAKPMAIDTETEIKPVIKEDAKALKIGREESANVEPEKTKVPTTTKAPVEVEAESKKLSAGKERNIDLQLDLEKNDAGDNGAVGVGGNKLQQHILPPHRQQQQQTNNEKTAQSGALPLPMSMHGWPGGLPHMRYMAPLQGVVSMDGTAVSSAAIQPPYLFTQPRPKRCATHCYIARSICYHQQIARMNSFWPAAPAAGSGSLYSTKPCNLNVLPSPDLHANIPGRGVNSVQDKGQGLAIFPGHTGKDKASPAASVADGAQRKQILLQQALPSGAPSNILQGPAIIFPLSQQQAVAAASVRPGSVKSPPATGNATTSSTPNSTPATASATAAAAAPAMTFNYPNMPGNEATQYLAINAYPFPIPAHVGGPSAYRGTHPQSMPFFNGPFYSTFHPSQLQQQQPPSHSQQNQQGHQNPSMSSSSSSSQKHLQNQQQRPPHAGGNVNGGGGSLQGFPSSKNQSSQPLQLQQRQQQGQHLSHPARQLESEMGSEDSPSTADSRVSRPSMSIYGQNFAMPIHATSFALMTPAPMGTAGGANGASGSNGEKKQQQQGSKSGAGEPSQTFAMSFASINGATSAPGIDITSSIAQQQAIFPDVRQGYQYMAAAAVAAAQQKKNFRSPEDGKTGGDSSNLEEERKTMKGSSSVGQSIAFSRTDLSDASGSTIPGNTVVDSSARTLNLSSTQQRPGSVMPAAISNVNASSAQQQLQRNQQQQQQQQQQQMIQLQKQQQPQQQIAAAARTKMPAASNGSVYSDHLPSSMATKFQNALSTYPQNLVHGSGSPAQSPQWKNSARPTNSQVLSPSMTSSTSSSLKSLSQQQGRTQQTRTQISFAANPKPSSQSQGLQTASSNQSPSPPVMVGSPTTSSVSKSAGGSPRTTTSTSAGNKVGHASSLSSQQAKNSPSVPSMKSSPVTGKNVPSNLGNPKAQLLQQPQLSSQQILPQAHLFFSPYIPTQAPHSNSPTATTAAASSAYYTQRRRPEQQQQSQSASGTSSSGMLSLCPVNLSNTGTSDPTKAAAASNMKGLPAQALMHPAEFAASAVVQSGNPHQLLTAGFPYVHAVPTVQVKPAEQKQPAA